MLPALRLSFLTLAVLLYHDRRRGQALGRGPGRGPGRRRRRLGREARQGQVGAGGRDRRRRREEGPARGRRRAPARRGRPGKVVFTSGQGEGRQDVPAALDGGKARGLQRSRGLLGKRLKGTADVKASAPVLAAKLCGKAAPADAADVLAAARPGRAADPAGARAAPAAAAPAPGAASVARPTPTATPTATPAGGPSAPATTTSTTTATARPTGGSGLLGRRRHDREQRGPRLRRVRGDAPASAWATTRPGSARHQPRLRRRSGGRVDVAPGDRHVHAPPTAASGTCNDPIAYARSTPRTARRDMVDMTLQLNGAGQLRPEGDDRALPPQRRGRRAAGRSTTADAPPAAAECANGKDDDGDGMVDRTTSPGATDPDPAARARPTRPRTPSCCAGDCEIDVGLRRRRALAGRRVRAAA